jgi:hypothetical protein
VKTNGGTVPSKANLTEIQSSKLYNKTKAANFEVVLRQIPLPVPGRNGGQGAQESFDEAEAKARRLITDYEKQLPGATRVLREGLADVAEVGPQL